MNTDLFGFGIMGTVLRVEILALEVCANCIEKRIGSGPRL